MPLAENEVSASAEDSVSYSAVTSCFTLTAALENGKLLGAHLSLDKSSGRDCTNALADLKARISASNQRVAAICGVGQSGFWSSSYFTAAPDFDRSSGAGASGGIGSRSLASSALPEIIDTDAYYDGDLPHDGLPQVFGLADKTGEFTVTWDGTRFSV